MKDSNAEKILKALDTHLNSVVELVLYGRAALFLGFPDPPHEFALSKDIDAVMWLGQAEKLHETTNFWDAVNIVNKELEAQGLYITHFFEENQVILTPDMVEIAEQFKLCSAKILDLAIEKKLFTAN